MTKLASRIGQWAHRRERELAEWEGKSPKRAGRGCYHAYSLLFIPLFVLTYLALPLSGREIIWNIDGLGQYYPFFIYEGQWLREIFGSIFSGQGIQIPLWEWCSGYGADIPTTFDVFLDPLNLVSGITPPSISEWVFQLLIVIRLYISGLAFVFYCRTRGENRTGIVLGALLYALSGAGLTAVRWSSGLHALMLFPIILAGAEQILQGKRPWVFVASLSLLAIVSYYFTYMACILLVGYLSVRVVMTERPNLTVGKFLRWVGIFAGLVVLCLLIAGFALVPAGIALMGMSRLVKQATEVPLLYGPQLLLEILSTFLSTQEVGSDTYQGLGGVGFFACLLLFSRKEQNKELKLVFLVLSACLLLPYVGSFFNGMNYATNRFAWAYTLCVSLVLTRMTPQLLCPSKRMMRTLFVGSAIYGLLFLVDHFRTEATVAGFGALLAALAIIVAFGNGSSRIPLTLALSVTLVVNGFYFLASSEGGKGEMQTPLGMAYKKLTAESNDLVATKAPKETWWRYDEGQLVPSLVNRIPNNSLVLGLQGIDFYNSVYNGDIDAFHTELAIIGDDINFRYANLQGRSDLMALLGVRYYAYRDDGTDTLPYGYSPDRIVAQQEAMGLNHQLVEAQQSLPIGIAFDKSLNHSDYAALSPAQKQQALLQAVVLENDAQRQSGSGAGKCDVSDLSFEDKDASFQVTGALGVRVEDGQFVVDRSNATVTLSVEGTPNAETYVYFSNLELHDALPSSFVSEEAKAEMLWHYKANLLLQDVTHVAVTNYELTAKSNVCNISGPITNSTPSNHMYGGKSTWLANLGYANEPTTGVTLTFSAPGIYTFDDFRIVTQTHEHQHEWVAARAASSLQNAKQGCNALTGSIDLNDPQTLLLTVAYSDGWQAYVDGAPAQILRADTGFMALDLPAGHHDIELRYQTPGLLLGFAVTGVGLLGVAAIAVVLRFQNRDAASPKSKETN